MKRVLLILCLAILLLLVACSSVEEDSALTDALAECDTHLSGDALLLDAVSAADSSFCASLDDDSICRAIVSADPSLCASDPSCEAMASRDLSLCPPFDATCEAFITDDPTPCESLDKELRGECLSFALKDTSYFSSSPARRDCEALVRRAFGMDSSSQDSLR